MLSIKSPAASANRPSAKPAYAVLCTPTQTYQLRQVQTSNTLFITQSALDSHGNDVPLAATRAIASCTATLELRPSDASAAALLREALPLYDIVAGDADATGNSNSKASVLEHLPLSEQQCQAGWKEIVAFEHQGSSFRPTPRALSTVWASIHSVALAEGIKLDKQFLTDDIVHAVAEERHPPGLVAAILSHVSPDDGDTIGAWSCLDGNKTVAFTGKTLLQANHGSDYLISDFTDAWQNHLPEAWRLQAKLEAIQGTYVLPTATTIRIADQPQTNTPKDAAPAIPAKSSARKWHEKFGKTRKQ